MECWFPPMEGLLKLNFDDGFKGNLGPIGAGGFFRNHEGESQAIFISNLVNSLNNRPELDGLLRGLWISQEKGYGSLVVEGDSKLLITTLKIILNSTL